MNLNDIAYIFLKKAHELGIPNSTMNNRMDLYLLYLPDMLLKLYFTHKEYELGKKLSSDMIKYKFNKIGEEWFIIFSFLVESMKYVNVTRKRYCENKLVTIVAPSGWIDKWDGESLNNQGLGGSETWVVKYAENIMRLSNTKVVVFCNCPENHKFVNGVEYIFLDEYTEFINTYNVDTAIISRYNTLLPVTCLSVENIYFVSHDIASNNIIPINDRIKKILCLSDWHKQNYIEFFPMFKHKVDKISYGIDANEYPVREKQPFSFIYSSFASRGLYWLLKLFPIITKKYPRAELHIYSNTKHPFELKNSKQEMEEIDRMIEEQHLNVSNHGWVSKQQLRQAWSQADVWFYPCKFRETFCLTALEAAISKTLAVTNSLAALNENCKGVVIEGDDVSVMDWQERALKALFEVLDNRELKNRYIENNYRWVLSQKNHNKVVREFMDLCMIE